MQSVRSRIPSIVLLLSAALFLGSVQASEPVFITEDANVLVDLEGETRLEINGLAGTLAIRLGKPGQIRYASRSLDNRRVEFPVELWREERTLLLVPVEGREHERVLVEIGVPPGMNVLVDVLDSRVDTNSLHGSLDVRGERLTVVGGAIKGSVSVNVIGGTVRLKNIEDEVDVRGKDLDVDIQGALGATSLSLANSEVTSVYAGSIEGDLVETELSADFVGGPVRLTMTAGKLELKQCAEGGELRLSGTDLSLAGSKGNLRVDTDASVTFQDHDGELRINGFGSSVRGSKSGGLLEVVTDSAEVFLDSLAGATTIRGRELTVRVTDAKSSVEVNGSYSTIQVERAAGDLKVESEFSDVEIQDAQAAVEIKSREDNLRVHGLKGALQLSAEGSDVDVAWVAFPAGESSVIENDRGNVRATLPYTGSCQIKADAPYGRVESSFPGVKVSDDGHHATGLTSQARRAPQVKRSVIRIRAGGDIFLEAAKEKAKIHTTPRRPAKANPPKKTEGDGP